MAQKNINRKHFLLSAGAALAGIVGLGRLYGSKAVPPVTANATVAEDRVQRDPRSVPVERDVV